MRPKPLRPPLNTLITHALDDMKAIDITHLNVVDIAHFTDDMYIATGRSNQHVKAISQCLLNSAAAQGYKPLGKEGEARGEWILIDFGDSLIHLMTAPMRDFYALERLWSTKPTSPEL